MSSKEEAKPASVSSVRSERTVVLNLSSLVKVVLVIILVGLSFWGGVLYGDSLRSSIAPTAVVEHHYYAIGLVVYISPTSITISNEDNTGQQTFAITNKTLISINGVRSNASQIKPGNIALIKGRSKSSPMASVILVNSHFSG